MKKFKEIICIVDNMINDKKNNTSDYTLVDIIHEQINFPRKIIRKGVVLGSLKINDKVVFNENYKFNKDSIIYFQDLLINTNKYHNVEPLNRFDSFITTCLNKCFNYDNINNLYPDQKKTLIAFIIEYFHQYGYNIQELEQSFFNKQIFNILDDFYINQFTNNKQSKPPRKKELIEKFIDERNQVFTDFENLIKLVKSGVYIFNEPQIFQDFSHNFNNRTYKLLIKPLYSIDLFTLLKNMIKYYNQTIYAKNTSDKLKYRSFAFKEFLKYETDYFNDNDKYSLAFKDLLNFLRNNSNDEIGFKETGQADISIKTINRTYNFVNLPILLYAHIENKGSGIARNISISCNSDICTIPIKTISDLLPPNETRNVSFEVIKFDLSKLVNKKIIIKLTITWINDFEEKFEKTIENFELTQQDENLPWDELRRTNPYSIKIINEPNKFFGREKLIEDIRWNIEENTTISSYILYGQKRVGKSSIARTLETIYKDFLDIIYVYKGIGSIKDTDANITFRKIGDSVAKEIINQFVKKHFQKTSERITIEKPIFSGSLAPLSQVVEDIKCINDNTRFIIVLDEFDELNQEFFENGEIGKTFALNIGKGLNEENFIGFILIGSENMEHKTRQGMRLNTFEGKKVDTFDKRTEFDSYCKIITEPTKSCMSFSSDFLDFLYNYTNGNPYFTNLLLGNIFKEAYDKKISFIDKDFSCQNIEYHLKIQPKKEFEHFWNDGIAEEEVNYEKVLDRRRRLLTAYAQLKKDKENFTWSDLKKVIKYPKSFTITESLMESTLNEFKQRNIIKEDVNTYLYLEPKLFEDWLIGPGIYQVIAQLEDKDDIVEKVIQEDKLKISDEEIDKINEYIDEKSKSNSHYKLTSFLNQFEDNLNRKLIAELLQRAYVIPSSEITSFLKKVYREIWCDPMLLLAGEKDFRKDGEIVCLEDSFSQNIPLCDLIKKVFKFSTQKTIKTQNDLIHLNKDIKHLILFEPLIDCPYFFRNQISVLLKKIKPSLFNHLDIHIMSFIITNEAKNEIEELLNNNFCFNYKLHFFNEVQRSEISPYLNNPDTLHDKTWSIINSIYNEVSDTSCIVKIGELIPLQCFPIFWSNEINGFEPLKNNNSNLSVYLNRINISQTIKDKFSFKSETNHTEFKASLIDPAINWKLINSKIREISKKKDMPVEEFDKILQEIDNNWEIKGKDIHNSKKQIMHSIAKNISAFSNNDGGEIFVGIEDDLTVQGLIYDINSNSNEENIRKAFDNLIKDYIGSEHSNICNLEFIPFDKFSVLKIIVKKTIGNKAIGLIKNKDGNQLKENSKEFYMRGQQEATLMSPQQYFSWIESRHNL